jgi:hypothetical protein
MAQSPSRFPVTFVVRDANGQALAYVYSRADPTEAHQAKTLTADEGRPIAANIARLPELLVKGGSRLSPAHTIACFSAWGHPSS